MHLPRLPRELRANCSIWKDLEKDPGETTNLYFTEQAKRRELKKLLERLKSSGRSAPRNRIPIGIENIPRIKE
jgi:hypothetical protein